MILLNDFFTIIIKLLKTNKNLSNDQIVNINNTGLHKRKSEQFDEKLSNFIESFNPSQSHYNINHAPKKLYIDQSFQMYPNKNVQNILSK